ncbi:MAG TPA: hypothetical protein VN181_13015, partial [Thermoanaerobaculia bacterium]|nr:hypothetical protein [Thermoanaerobaculia bacterium]
GLLKSVSGSFLNSGSGVICESFRLLHGRETHVIDFDSESKVAGVLRARRAGRDGMLFGAVA